MQLWVARRRDGRAGGGCSSASVQEGYHQRADGDVRLEDVVRGHRRQHPEVERLVFVASIRICSLLARQLVRCEVAVEQCVKLEDRAVRLRRCICDATRPRGMRGGERVARAQLMHLALKL